MVNAEEKRGRGDEYIIDLLKHVRTPVFLVINKIDLVHPDDLLAFIEQYKDLYPFREVVRFPRSEEITSTGCSVPSRNICRKPPQYYPATR